MYIVSFPPYDDNFEADMTSRNPVARLLLLLLPALLSAQVTDAAKHTRYLSAAERMVTAALTDTSAFHQLRELCALGHRLPGSDAAETALNWAESLMQTMELDSVWRQPCPVPRWERGEVERAVLMANGSKADQPLAIAALGGSVGTSQQGVSAAVIEINSWDELARRADEVKGRIVLFNRPMDPGRVETFSAYGQAVDQRVQGASRAAALGAVAVLVRSVTTKYDTVPHVGTLSYNAAAARIPAAAISLIDADRLSQAIVQNPDIFVHMTLSCRRLPDGLSSNLIGEIRGSEKPNEVIVIGGHFDCWDKGVGAHDDGAGCLQSLEVLTLFRRLGFKPKRTIRTVFFMNEEYGLTGAVAYGQWSALSGETHVAGIEADRGATTPRGFNVTTSKNRLERLQRWLPYLRRARIEWVRQGGAGGDVAQINNAQALFGFVPDIQRYFDWHHSANDQFDQVHPREMELGSAAMAILTYLLSEEGLE